MVSRGYASKDGLLYEWNNTDWLCVKVLSRLVRRDRAFAERFVGWTARADAERVWTFTCARLAQFTSEGLRYTVEKYPEARRAEALALWMKAHGKTG